MSGEGVGGEERRLVAILSADVVGYSRLMAEDEDATVRALRAYREEIELLVRQHRGRVVDFTGDNFLAEFPSAVNAALSAMEIQRVLAARNAPLDPHRRLEFRMGLNLGEVRVEGERIFGDGINIAARLEDLAEPGGICLSETVRNELASRLDLELDDLGEQKLKNIGRPVRAFRIGMEGPVKRSPTARAGRPSIAVLPFSNMSGDEQQDYFSDGITEELIAELTRFRELAVLARNTTFQYRGKAVDVKKLGAELGVAYVVEGSVRTAGGRVRVTAQLLDALSGDHVWAETYDRQLTPENIFEVQDDIKEKIVATIADSFGVIFRAALTQTRRKAPENLTAYEAVLLAKAFYRDSTTEEVHLRACEALERAVELEPTYAEAWAWLAAAYRDEHMWGYTRGVEPLGRAFEAAQRALEFDPINQMALQVLAQVHFYRHEMDEWYRVAERAMGLNPNRPSLLNTIATGMSYAGLDRGVELAEKALSLSPDPPEHFYLPFAFHHYRRGEYEQALDYAQRFDTRGWEGFSWMIRAAACGKLGRREDASLMLKKLLERHPNFPNTVREHWLRKFNVPEEFIEQFVDGLRKAGLNIPDEDPDARVR